MRDRIYFVSDAHLGSRDHTDPTEQRERDLIAFLRQLEPHAEALYLMGDLFDFWFEYRSVVPHTAARVLFALHRLVQRGVRVVLLPGNHDIWLGDYLERQVGLELWTGPRVVTHQAQRILLAHGDEFRSDWPFRISRAILKSRLNIALFRWLHPDLAHGLAMATSLGSGKLSHGRLSRRSANWRRDLAPGLERLGSEADLLLCGHFHRPQRHRVAGGELVVLGAWLRRRRYGLLRDGVLEQRRFRPGDAPS